MTHVIVAATPAYGHVAPLRSIAVDLQNRGHHVTMMTGSAFGTSIEAAGLRFVAFEGIADFDSSHLSVFPARANAPAGPPQIDFDIRHLFADPIPAQYHALQLLLAEAETHQPGEPVVLLHDTVFMGIWPALCGAPGRRPKGVIGIGVNPLPARSVDTAPFGLGLPPDSSVEGRARNASLNALVENEVFAGAQAHVAKILDSVGALRLPPFVFDAFVTLPDLYLQLSIAELEYKRSDAPDGLRFIGSLPATLPSFEPPHWWDKMRVARHVVAVTQGTVANRDLCELIIPTLAALDGMDVFVIALTGRAESLIASVPANAHAIDFIPFDVLLPHVDVLVSNGGYGGVQQALGHGVPLVLAGESEDKIEVTARAAHTGAALNLSTSKPTVEALRNAISLVLTEPTYRLHAKRLQQSYHLRNAFAEVDAAVRELAQTT